MKRELGSLSVVVVLLIASACTGPAFGSGPQLSESGRLPGIVNNLNQPNGGDPVALVNLWRVTARGESPDTWLWLGGNGSYGLWRPFCRIDGSWRANSTSFLASAPEGMSGGCDADFSPIPWLSGATTYAITSSGISLINESGQGTARLRYDGTIPPRIAGIWDEIDSRRPPEITDELRARLTDPVALPENVQVPALNDILGRWEVPDEYIRPMGGTNFTTRPFAEFKADGTWIGLDGCNGQGGAWRLGEAGRLMGTQGIMTQMGCVGAPVGSWVNNAGRAGLVGNQLVLFDRAGQELGRFDRS